jgi:hypothetical protein
MMAAMTTESPMHGLHAGVVRLRRAVLWLIFGSILMIPKINRLRRHRRAWNFGRSFAGLVGVAMIAIGAAEQHKFAIVALGALALLLALLLAPERPKRSVDARARELGALVVVDGGVYNSDAEAPHRAKLFIGSDRLWVLNSALAVLSEIPLQQLRELILEPSGADWKLRLDCGQSAAEFLYRGDFAEHLARVADETLRSRLHRELPVLP